MSPEAVPIARVSAAGLRNPRDRRNQMLRSFIRLVEELRPQWFVMENVPGLTHANNRQCDILGAIFEEFEAIGDGEYELAGDVRQPPTSASRNCAIVSLSWAQTRERQSVFPYQLMRPW